MLPGQHLQIVTLIFVYQQVHLEHIPKDSIKKIFIELRRILKKDGVVCATIDYTDHYAHTDKNIGLLNFLSYFIFEIKVVKSFVQSYIGIFCVKELLDLFKRSKKSTQS